MKKITLWAATVAVMFFAVACGSKKQEESAQSATAAAEAAPAKSYLDMLQGSWETGDPNDSETWASLIITGNEAMSNSGEEYGPDKISIEGDIITYTNEVLGGEPRKNKIIKLTENEFVEQALDGSYTNTWRRRKD